MLMYYVTAGGTVHPTHPTAFETDLGWVLCGTAGSASPSVQANVHVTAFNVSVMSCDDVLRKFWELEEAPSEEICQSAEERMVVRYFQSDHSRTKEGRFVVPLPKNPSAELIGESRSQAVRRFLSLESSLNGKGCFQEFDAVMQKYFDLGHAEPVPTQDMDKSPALTFYLPMHAVYKTSSTTTRVRAVFDASTKSSTGVSLNDTLLVGPTLHPPLIDVLLRFRLYPVALTADVSKMYRAVELAELDKDLHRFVWRSHPKVPLTDYRMTRLTFGVSASSFAANMAVKQNAIDHADEFPVASEVVHKSFYVDDCLTDAQDSTSALLLQQRLTKLFSLGGFVLRKWNSNDLCVLKEIPKDLRDSREVHTFKEDNKSSRALGIEWNIASDRLHLNISDPPDNSNMTKRSLISDVAKVFDALGLFSPVTVKMKILLQRLWEVKLDWDDPVPEDLLEVWTQWRTELPLLSEIQIPRCCIGDVHTEIVIAKTKVSPIKRISIPRLELCGAHLLTKLLCNAKRILNISVGSVFAWTDSTIVLTWLTGNPRRFKTYVGNRVSFIVDQLPPDCWRHVAGSENPADCASRGPFPQQLKDHKLWWKGPLWLQLDCSHWPTQPNSLSETVPMEEREICHLVITAPVDPIIPITQYSSFGKLKRVTAWVFRFVKNLRSPVSQRCLSPHLMVTELSTAESYWLMVTQRENFPEECNALKCGQSISRKSRLLPFHPVWDRNNSLIRVGGRLHNSSLSYARQHPVILDGKHPIVKLIILSEHLRLMHA